MIGQALLIATAGGLAAQLGMVLTGHFVPWVKDNVFAVGGMTISLAAGLAFSLLAQAGWQGSLAGGLAAGGVCALVGIAVSLALGDVPPAVLIFGTLASAATGLAGAAVGKLVG